MATVIVDRYIGDNGVVLLPLQGTANNTSDLISDTGVYFMAQTHEEVIILEGNPMGLLLAITYSATP